MSLGSFEEKLKERVNWRICEGRLGDGGVCSVRMRVRVCVLNIRNFQIVRPVKSTTSKKWFIHINCESLSSEHQLSRDSYGISVLSQRGLTSN